MDDSGWDDLFAKAAGQGDNTPVPKATSHKKRKKRKRSELLGDKKSTFLEGRMRCHSDDDGMPSGFVLGSLLVSPELCEGWKQDESFLCSECGRPASCHRLESEELAELCAIRNARCLSFMAVRNNSTKILRQALSESKRLSIRVHQSHIRDTGIRIMIACDKRYFELYYQQLTESTTLGDYPHPPAYFGSPCFCLDPSVHPLTHDRHELALANTHQPTTPEHPLAQLHRLRSKETAVLFQTTGWVTDAANRNEMCRVLKRPVRHSEYHETPVPALLSDWNDACRDILCNLYCYATLPPAAIPRLRNHLAGMRVLEMGAGTGYLAKLLHNAGIACDARDICPTSRVTNEYHGRVPPFCRVGSLWSKAEALLLCYPPPQSPMARDCLREFLRAGGRCFVHIGEMRGLTGCGAFEKLLLENLSCVERIPCLWWGTDASSITVWTKETTGSKLLLPCLACEKKESTRRSRILRHLSYCSEACFEAHQATFRHHLLCGSLPIHVDALDFNNDLHFAPLNR